MKTLFFLFFIFSIYNTNIVHAQTNYDVVNDTILIVKDIGIKHGNGILVRKEYLLSLDSIFFYCYPDWEIIEYRIDIIDVNLQYQSYISQTNKISNEIKSHISKSEILCIIFSDIKVNNNNKSFVIKGIFNINIANNSTFDKKNNYNNDSADNKRSKYNIDLYKDTILILNDISVFKFGLLSTEYLLSIDSLYFYGHPDWEIIEFHLHYFGRWHPSPSVSYSNKITDDMKSKIKGQIGRVCFSNFKIKIKNGSIINFNKWNYIKIDNKKNFFDNIYRELFIEDSKE